MSSSRLDRLRLCSKIIADEILLLYRGGDGAVSEEPRSQMLAPEEPADDQPRYPLSFDELAEMIATGAHIPGIREIPDKINEGPPSEPVLAKSQMRKPWEGAPQSIQAGQSLFAMLEQSDDVKQ
jgi:hypothetical protein